MVDFSIIFVSLPKIVKSIKTEYMKRIKMFASWLLLVLAVATLVGCSTSTPTPDDRPTPPEQEKAFSFDGITVDHTSFKLNVKPEDKEMEYLVLLAEKKHFQANHIDTREELLEDDYLYITQLAEYYGMGLRDFLSAVGWLVQGDKIGYGAINLFPDTEYVVYCYGVTFDGELYEATTEICYVEIDTTAPALIDATFNMDAVINGNVATVTITPEGYEGLYYYYIVPDTDSYYLPEGMEFSDTYLEYYRNRAFNEFNAAINDLGMAAKEFCAQGEYEFTERLEPNKGYLVLVFAVSEDDVPLLCSVPSLCYFDVAGASMSEMTIDISVTGITPYFAELTVTPSVNNEEYACVFLSKAQVPQYEDEYEQMVAIIEDYQPAIFRGAWSEILKPLMPSTEYTVLAFGVDNNLPSTKLFRFDFTSDVADEGKITIESIDIVKVFDVQEIIALDSSYAKVLSECECLAIVEATTSVPTDKVNFWWYEGWMKVEYSDEAFLEDLLLYDYSDNPQMMDMYYSMDSDDKFFFVGIAEDDEGNLSPLYYGEEFILTQDMCSPAEEFFSYVATRSTNSAMLLSRFSR